jgi:hypothetical protein
MVQKHLLVPQRVRQTPSSGFSWVDRRFVRDYAEGLGRDAILLYLFLAAVSDKHGLSFWSDAKIALRLKLEVDAVARARDELLRRDLVAYAAPLAQVLALAESRPKQPGGEPTAIGDILRRLSGGAS